jgi:hypothetical protein
MINLNLNGKTGGFLRAILAGGLTAGLAWLAGFPETAVVSGIATMAIQAVFVGLVVFEQINDTFRFREWNRRRSERLALHDGIYECGNCGSRTIRETELLLPVMRNGVYECRRHR